jgi:predicted RNase H-like nuclease
MYVGVDGCKNGWIIVELTDDDNWKVDIFPDIASLWNECKRASLILIDMPIGLRESGFEERQCDKKAREMLGPKRASTVFPAPCRGALDASSYEQACQINKRMTGRKLSLQTWSILPKIREVNNLLINDALSRSHIRETHPEVCFWALADGRPMLHSKKKEEGRSERLELLKTIYPQTEEVIKYASKNWLRRDLALDDILDALVAAVTVKNGRNNLVSIPEVPEIDSYGLPMEIVYFYDTSKSSVS